MGKIEGSVRPKTFLALVLLLHFLAHPAVHLPAIGHADAASLSAPSQSDSPAAARESLGSCLACRTASSVVAPLLPVFLPALAPVAAQPAATTEFLYAHVTDHTLSSRAPPRG